MHPQSDSPLWKLEQVSKIAWIGLAYEDRLICVYHDGRTFRLDKDGETKERYWTEIAKLPE